LIPEINCTDRLCQEKAIENIFLFALGFRTFSHSLGQKRKSGEANATSDLPRKADIKRTSRDVPKVPTGDIRNERGRQLRRPLLCLLGVKGGLLGLQIGDQFFDPIERRLIGDLGRQVPVVFDLDVEFDALVAHLQFRIRA
jgi:hypothetical protein